MQKLRLGLDLGTNSIGWCLLNLDETGAPISLFRTGVRIFSDGRDRQSLGSLTADRRQARSARRRRDRFLQRQKYLLNTLVEFGLMPENEADRRALAFLDPYSIRKKALDEELSPYQIGRAIFHINQRRGFKSNRKSADNEAGVVKRSIADLEMKLGVAGARTFGEFLAERHANCKTVRARRTGAKNDDLYELYPDRAMLQREFDLIWSKQADYDPALFSAEKGEHIKGIIFFQRPLKPQEVGKCTLLSDKHRAAKALPSWQRFRIYQELSNLRWIDRQGAAHLVTKTPGLRDRFFDELERKKKLTFDAMRAIMRKQGVVDHHVTFNLESDLRDHLIGNLTSCIMRDGKRMIGPKWDGLDNERQDGLVSLLLDNRVEDEEAANTLRAEFGFDEDEVQRCLDAKLPTGYGALSLEAVELVLPILKDQGLIYYDAVREAGLGEANLFDPNAPLHERLEYYGKVLQRHVTGGDLEATDAKSRYGKISNPTVHIVLNQVRAVVNELIRLHGKPEQIVIEVARNLPLGAEGRRDLKKQHKQGKKRNQRAADELAKLGLENNRENRQKFLLWEQLSKDDDPTDRKCPFTGRMICLSDLFSDTVEIEHLLPFSLSLDDSMANKVVCFREANRYKGKKAPFDAFGHSPDGYDWQAILQRSKELPYSKQWRFLPDAINKFDAQDGFLGRQLNDTRYISRYTAEYLSSIIPQNKIWVVTGRLTALLRGFWGLNNVLQPSGRQAKKSRDDHRHHAVDAVVVAMTSRAMLQKVSRAARRSEELDLHSLFDDRIDPWEGFRDEVKRHIDGIIVSHRPRKKIQGQLHKDTAYGPVDFADGEVSQVVHRVPIETFEKPDALGKIRDSFIRISLKRETSGLSGNAFQDAVRAWCAEHGIRSLRILESLSVIPVRDRQGNVYKAHKGDSNAHVDIYEDLRTGKWQGEVVSRFNANQPDFTPKWKCDNPEAPPVMRLRIDDLVAMNEGDGRCIFRVQKISNSITLAPHNEANVDARNRSDDDPFKFVSKSPDALRLLDSRRVHISPTGLVSEVK